MTDTDPFTEAARAEAIRAWVKESDRMDSIGTLGAHMAEWARTYLAAQEPSHEEVRALGRGLNEAGWTCHEGGDNPGFYDECEDCRRVCDDLARTALSAARHYRDAHYPEETP